MLKMFPSLLPSCGQPLDSPVTYKCNHSIYHHHSIFKLVMVTSSSQSETATLQVEIHMRLCIFIYGLMAIHTLLQFLVTF